MQSLGAPCPFSSAPQEPGGFTEPGVNAGGSVTAPTPGPLPSVWLALPRPPTCDLCQVPSPLPVLLLANLPSTSLSALPFGSGPITASPQIPLLKP